MLFMMFAAASSAMADTMEFSYDTYGEAPEWFGYKKAETYDVAIRISDSGLAGKRVVGIKVPVNASVENIEGCKGWLSQQLDAETIDKQSVFNPDIISIEGKFADGLLTVSFPEPVQIPDEGVYIGYSYDIVNVDAASYKSVAVTDGKTAGGLWVHSSLTQKTWADMTKRGSLVSVMTVILEGDFLKDAAVPAFSGDIRIAEGEASYIPLELTNNGADGISSIEYSYEISNVKGTGVYEFTSPVPPVYGRKGIATVEIDPVEGLGETSLSLSVVKVNGKANEGTETQATAPVTVQKFVPVYRPLVEEFTGLNCGYCPRGYVMLEEMKEAYGDRFVALSYHSLGWESNAMDCIDSDNLPVIPSGYPAASLNRNQTVDPSDIPMLWEKCYRNQTPAEVLVDWNWSEDNPDKLKAIAKVRFLQDMDESDYRLAFVMLADGLTNPKWIQDNYYSNYDPKEYSGPYWDLFIGKGEHVMGLTFNDIVVYATDYKGVEESLPARIESGEWYEYSIEIDPEDIVNLKGTHIVDNFDLTRMVAIIVEGKNGKPLNSISSGYPANGMGTDMTAAIEEPETILYFDTQGRRVEYPSQGIFIKTEIFNDGSLRTSKIIK